MKNLINFFFSQNTKTKENGAFSPRTQSIIGFVVFIFLVIGFVYYNYTTDDYNNYKNLEIFEDYRNSAGEILRDSFTEYKSKRYNYYLDSLERNLVEAKPIKITKHGGYWVNERDVHTSVDNECEKSCKSKFDGNLEIACLTKCVTVKPYYYEHYIDVWYDTLWSEGVKEYRCSYYKCTRKQYLSRLSDKYSSNDVDSIKKIKIDSLRNSYTFLPCKGYGLSFDSYSFNFLEKHKNDYILFNSYLIIPIFIYFLWLAIRWKLYKKKIQLYNQRKSLIDILNKKRCELQNLSKLKNMLYGKKSIILNDDGESEEYKKISKDYGEICDSYNKCLNEFIDIEEQLNKLE